MSAGNDLFSVICADGIVLVRFFQLRFQAVALSRRQCRREAWAATLEVLDRMHPILLDLECIRKDQPFVRWDLAVERLLWLVADEVYRSRRAKYRKGDQWHPTT